jgi:hypothetical protein
MQVDVWKFCRFYVAEPLKSQAHLNMFKFKSLCHGKPLRVRYEDRLINGVQVNNRCPENHTKHLHYVNKMQNYLTSSRWRTCFKKWISSLSLFPVAPTLEFGASVKRFVSLQFLNPKTVGRTPWTGDQPVTRPLPT